MNMRRLPAVLLGCLLVSSPAVFGQSRPDRPSGKKGAEISAPWSRPFEIKAIDRAFFSLAGEQVSSGEASSTTRELKFEVRIKGRVVLEDVLEIPANATEGTFELLAGDPDTLRRLFELSRTAGQQTEIAVFLDKQPLRKLSLSELVSYSKRFQGSPPEITPPISEIRRFGPEINPRGSADADILSLNMAGWDENCLANCDVNRDDCYQTEPECFGLDYCEVCEDQWAVCQNGCWVCEDPKSVTEFDRSWLKSGSWVGSSCWDDWSQSPTWYDKWNIVIQTDRVRRTEYCNGSVVETILSSSNTYSSCIRNTYDSCFYSSGFPFGSSCPF